MLNSSLKNKFFWPLFSKCCLSFWHGECIPNLFYMSFFVFFFLFFWIRDFHLYLMDVMLNQEYVHVKVLAFNKSLCIGEWLMFDFNRLLCFVIQVISKALEGLSLESGANLQKVLIINTYTSSVDALQRLEALLPVFRSRMGAMLFLISALLSRGMVTSFLFFHLCVCVVWG